MSVQAPKFCVRLVLVLFSIRGYRASNADVYSGAHAYWTSAIVVNTDNSATVNTNNRCRSAIWCRISYLFYYHYHVFATWCLFASDTSHRVTLHVATRYLTVSFVDKRHDKAAKSLINAAVSHPQYFSAPFGLLKKPYFTDATRVLLNHLLHKYHR